MLSTLPLAAPPLDTSSLRRLFWLRWILLATQLILMLLAPLIFGVQLPVAPLLSVMGLHAVFNLLTGWRVRRDRPIRHIEITAQLLVDLTALSALLYFTGGATNPFVSFYLPALAIAAAMLPLAHVVGLTLYALAAYSMMLGNYIPMNLLNQADAVAYHLAGMWIDFVASSAMIAGFTARLSAALREREAELADARERLLREQRIEALVSQGASVAHEMGTPLSTVAVIAGELQHDARQPDSPLVPYREDLRAIEQQLELCRAALARLQRKPNDGTPEPLGLWLPAFTQTWQLRHPDIRLHTESSPVAQAVELDAVSVGQILTILLDNAARSQQQAGRDQVPLLLTARIDASVDTLREAPRQIVLSVVDTGLGLPEDLRTALGRTPVPSRHGGHGIGLYLAATTARRLGGTVELRPNPPQGAIAELRLPVAGPAVQPAAPVIGAPTLFT
ncbi:HAMP domain-containing histidine kinase [Ralstonia solanacearum]|uniref:histidine kinase n=1 Tax=Ralstonia solanacearum K60 TaxID=1091042 RepID=A0AAP8D431_RALSL|nr:ATP-binding protein [Ralstonia solanacearum]MBT1536811.1 HAMP domain-containing histidine kinase [Ralstonia solanacearum]OYQ13266.1 ATP-binding protein [Ralstonia solanacearum K60]QOK83620.1 HAMP domain-containing histidine kinase [Ralstonia solanacearum]RIJ87030.1 sensor histidine kinase [Ralstonia solanacearum]CCF96054.1 putative sensor histidine kinase [Ralstonia solanacearum K60]